MKRKIAISLLALSMIFTCLAGLCACNGRNGDNLNLKTGSRPDYDSLISAGDSELINLALSESATESQKKAAVLALYNVANGSRLNTDLSLMLQSSDAGIALGDVIMHGFNLKSGNAWYYQLAVQATSGIIGPLIQEFAGLLKVAYTTGDGEYYYTVVKGSKSECDCTVETFPYATFVLTEQPKVYDEAGFKKEIHYLNGMHEINNMKFCADIIADGAKIIYDAQQKFYKVEFSVDMKADTDLLNEWFALPKEDMQVGGQTLKYYKYYNAVLEVWDNGYAKSFKASSDREAGMGSGAPTDSFQYIWKENEIVSLLKEDAGIKKEAHNLMETVDDYLEYYRNPEFVEARLSEIKIAGIVVGCVLVAALIAIIITVIIVETRLKQGKMPKLAAKRAAKKQKRLERKKRKGKVDSAEDDFNRQQGSEEDSDFENSIDDLNDIF